MDFDAYAGLIGTLQATLLDHLQFETGLMIYYHGEKPSLPCEYQLGLHTLSRSHRCSIFRIRKPIGRPRTPDHADRFCINRSLVGGCDKLSLLLGYMKSVGQTRFRFYGYAVKGPDNTVCDHITGLLPVGKKEMRSLFLYCVKRFHIPLTFPPEEDISFSKEDFSIFRCILTAEPEQSEE